MNELVTLTPFCIEKEDQKVENTEFLQHDLSRGRYDIDYVINLCKILVERCEALKFSGHNGMLTIRDSLKKHLAMVEIDKQKMQNKDKIVNLECQLCGKSTLVPAKYISQWECQNCKHLIDTI